MSVERKLSHRLFRGEEGSVMVIMALILVVLIGVVGFAVDAARAYSVKQRLQEALDAAALVGARNYVEADRDDQIRNYFGFGSGGGSLPLGGPSTCSVCVKGGITSSRWLQYEQRSQASRQIQKLGCRRPCDYYRTAKSSSRGERVITVSVFDSAGGKGQPTIE